MADGIGFDRSAPTSGQDSRGPADIVIAPLKRVRDAAVVENRAGRRLV